MHTLKLYKHALSHSESQSLFSCLLLCESTDVTEETASSLLGIRTDSDTDNDAFIITLVASYVAHMSSAVYNGQ